MLPLIVQMAMAVGIFIYEKINAQNNTEVVHAIPVYCYRPVDRQLF